jgi:hypothetical protein
LCLKTLHFQVRLLALPSDIKKLARNEGPSLSGPLRRPVLKLNS